MNQKIKISQLPAKGSNLAAADLLEIAEFTGTGYISKSITGAEIAAGATAGFVPETRTLTINGTTQDLSADRTFTISTGITIGTTLITSGTVGRVLFEGTGNVVQESANLTFDSATTKLQLGILTPTATTTPAVLSLGATYGTNAVGSTSNIKLKIYDDNTAGGVYGFGLTSNLLEIHSPNTTGIFSGGGATRTQVFSVNTAGSLFGSTTLIATTQPFLVALGGTYGSNTAGSVANLKLKILGSNAFSSLTDYGLGISAGLFEFSASDAFGFFTGNSLTRTERMRIFAGGNIGINTTTDAGFRLDVNGTSRVSSNISGIYDGLQVRNSAGASNAQARIKFDNDITPTQTSTGGVVFYTSSVFSGFPSSSFGLWNYNSNGVIAFATNSTERLRIFSTGNIGINTTTDAGFRLDVNGTARLGASTIQTLTVGLGTGSQSHNTVLGLSAFSSNTSGNFNVAIGPSALFSNTTGTGNIGIGHFSAVQIGAGTNNVAIGREALSNGNSTGNVAIGFQACSTATGTNNIVIGLQSQAGNFNGSIVLGINASATAGNQFVVGSTGTNAGSVTTEVNASTQVWNVIINGVARKILLA